jgi:SAM-dependent methyltransferase
VTALGDSVFNYTDYMPERFLHYYQQISHVQAFHPKRMLEIGPGDHTVTDFLRRKGIEVDTYDNDAKLAPTYLGDIRKELVTRGGYDLVLASEVFEHMNIQWLPQILGNIRRVLAPGGILLVSLPYSTLRLFPPRSDYGRIISCEGRVRTHIPLYFLHTLLWPARVLYRLAWKRSGWQHAIERPVLPRYPDDKFDVHHWDLGIFPTTRRAVRKIFAQQYEIVFEEAYVNTNCVFFALRSPAPERRGGRG